MAFVAIEVQAQTNTIPPSNIESFWTDVVPYLSVSDTNTTVAVASAFEVFNETIFYNGQNLVDRLGARLNFSTATTPQPSFKTWFVDGGMRYAGVGGVIDGGDGGGGYSIIKYDVRVSIGADIGYSKTLNEGHGSAYFKPAVTLQKAASKVLPGVSIGYPIQFANHAKQGSYPDISAFVSLPF